MSGSRIKLPPNALKVCASCGIARGTKTKWWTPVHRGGSVVSYTCPECPKATEPIRLKDGKFYAVVGVPGEDGKRRQLSRRFLVLDDAREWVAEVREDAEKAKTAAFIDPRKLTVRELTKRWLTKREQEVDTPGGVRLNTLNGYRSALSSLLVILGDRPAREVTADDVEGALLKLAKEGGKWGRPLSHRSLVYALGALRQVYGYALRSGWVKSNPAALVKAPGKNQDKADDADPRRWTTAQLLKFRTYVDSLPLTAEPWVKAGMRLTLAGLRRSEVLGLDWSNVNRQTGEVRVTASRTKDGRGSTWTLNDTKTANSKRTVQAETLHAGSTAALRKLWLAQGRPASGLVIADAEGNPVQPDKYSAEFRALCTAAGVPYPGSIHTLRHSLATIL